MASWKIATTPARAEPDGGTAARKPVGFVEAAILQWVNPKAWLVGVGAAGTYLQADAESPLLQALWFAVLFVAAALPSGFAWLLFGASLQRFLRSPRAARIFNIAMGASLAASVVLILW